MPNTFINSIKPNSSFKGKAVDRETLKKLETDPKYKELMQKYKSSLDRNVNFNISTNSLNTQGNDDIGIFTQAEQILEQLCEGSRQLGDLSLETKCMILYYLERYNKRVGRILDIFTRIPLSSLRLQKPNTKWNIVNDYVLYKFEQLFNSKGFQDTIEKLIRHYWLFSFGAVLVEDDFTFCKDSTIFDNIDLKNDLDSIVNKLAENKKTLDLDTLKEIDKQYLETPDSVSSTDRLKVIESVLNIHSKKFKGIFKLSVLPVESTINRFENNDVGYYVYQIPITQNLIQTIELTKDALTFEDSKYSEFIYQIKQVGYSEAMVNVAMDSNNNETIVGLGNQRNNTQNNQNIALVDNDAFNNLGMYIATFQKSGLSHKDNSLFNRVIMDCVALQIATRRLREKVNRGFKKDLLVTVDENVGQDKIDMLNAELNQASQNAEGTILTTNISGVSVDELDLNVNSDLDLDGLIENAENNILEGVGVPSSLITDSDDAYSNSFLKTTILENEMTSFRYTFADFIENQIFKPLALKWGFIAQGEWGEAEIVYPKLRFTKFSLARGSDDIVFMQELAENGQLPLRDIFEALGIDMDEALQRVREEQSSLLNPDLKEVYSEKIGEIAGELLSQEAQGNSKFMQGIAENLGLKAWKLNSNKAQDSNNDNVENDLSFNKGKFKRK